MQVTGNWDFNWQEAKRRYGLIFLLAALMTNLGYGRNLLLALQCEQYYFEYLLFFILVYGARVLSDQFSVPSEKQGAWKVALKAGGLISITFFGILWAYNVLTNCPFEPVRFLTSRLPLIILLSGLYQYWRFDQESQRQPTGSITVKTFNNGQLRLLKNEIVSARLENGLINVTLISGECHMVDTSLKAFQQDIADEKQFYRLNRTTLINRDQVESFRTNEKHHLCVTLRNGTRVEVNKNKVKAFKSWLGQFPL